MSKIISDQIATMDDVLLQVIKQVLGHDPSEPDYKLFSIEIYNSEWHIFFRKTKLGIMKSSITDDYKFLIEFEPTRNYI